MKKIWENDEYKSQLIEEMERDAREWITEYNHSKRDKIMCETVFL